MQRRLAKLEAALAPELLREAAMVAAEAAGLDPEEVFREAEAILKRCAGLSLPEIAAQEGLDPAELEALLTGRVRQRPA